MRDLIVGQTSIWWRGSILVKENRLLPVGETLEEYDPFSFYYPPDRFKRHSQHRSLPFLLLDVNPYRIDEIVRFSTQFGVLGELEPSESREERESRSEPTSLRCTPMPIERFRHVHHELRETLTWIEQMNPGPPVLLPGFSKKQQRELRPHVEQSVREWLSGRFAEKLQPVHLWPQWNSKTASWVTHWDIGTLEAGLYLMLLLHMQGHGRIVSCPRCQKSFVADRPRTTFCSPACQNAYKVQRWRAKKKKSSTRAKGGSHGTKGRER